MINMIKSHLLIIFICAFQLVNAQSGVSRGARSQYAGTVEIVDGNYQTTRMTYEEYDKKGHVILEIVLNSDSTIKSKDTYQYNRKGNETEHIKYNANNKVITKNNTTYDRFNQKKINHNLQRRKCDNRANSFYLRQFWA